MVPTSYQWADRVGGGMTSDTLITQELATQYAADIEAQMVGGSGSSGQFLGVRNVSTVAVSPEVPGAVATTYTDASPTAAKLAQAISQLVAVQAGTRLRMASILLARPELISFVLGSLDAAGNDQIQRPGTGLLAQDDGPFGPIAPGLGIYSDTTVPNNLGVGTNQTQVISLYLPDLLLFVDEPIFGIDDQQFASSLTTVFTSHSYGAFFSNLEPSAVGTLGGTGLIIQSGWHA
jgi:hypothetical protein